MKNIFALKQLALMGALNDFIGISSGEFGKFMQLSQQAASKRILDLVNNGLIERRLGVRQQQIKLTKKAKDILKKEYLDYQQLFESFDYLKIIGKVVSGMGEGKYYITQENYKNQFIEKLGFEPYKGTLNIEVDRNDLSKIWLLKNTKGIQINGFRSANRTFGACKCFVCKTKENDCAIIMPLRSHYTTTLEILSNKYLRRKLNVKDGDDVEIEVKL